MFLPFPAPRC